MTRHARLLCLLCLLGAVPAAAADADPVLVAVDGRPIRRGEVADLLWRRHASAGLQELVDQVLIDRAAEALKVAPDKAEVEARLKRIQSQFPDEKTFSERLAAGGSSREQIRASIEEQVRRESLVVRAKGLSVTDGELKGFFEAEKERLGAPQTVRLRHILLASEKEAGDFLIAVRAGADFARLASQVSLDAGTKDKGGDLGFVAKGMLPPELERVALGLKPGEVGGPARTSLGFHLVKAEEVRPAKPPVFKEIRDDLRQALLADKIAKAWPGYLAELRQGAKYEPGQAGPAPQPR